MFLCLLPEVTQGEEKRTCRRWCLGRWCARTPGTGRSTMTARNPSMSTTVCAGRWCWSWVSVSHRERWGRGEGVTRTGDKGVTQRGPLQYCIIICKTLHFRFVSLPVTPLCFFSPLTYCSCDTRIRNGWYGCHRGPEVLQLYHCLNFYPLLCCAKKKKYFFCLSVGEIYNHFLSG